MTICFLSLLTDCQCPKDVIPALQSLVNDLLALSDENENSPRDLENTNLLFGECSVLELGASCQYGRCLSHNLGLTA